MISEAATITNWFSRGTPCALPPEADHPVPELAIVHVEGPRPGDGDGVDAERVPVVDRRVEGGREEVVRRLHGVEVAVEMEVDLLHRDDLGVPAAVAAPFDPEDRSHRRLAEAEHHVLADPAHPLGERDRRRGLALARLRRRDRGRDHELAVRPVGEAVEDREGDLRFGSAVELELLLEDPRVGCDVGDRTKDGLLRDLQPALHGLASPRFPCVRPAPRSGQGRVRIPLRSRVARLHSRVALATIPAWRVATTLGVGCAHPAR